MNILKFIKSLFIKDEKIETVVETTTETTTAAVLAGEATVVIKRKKPVKRKK